MHRTWHILTVFDSFVKAIYMYSVRSKSCCMSVWSRSGICKFTFQGLCGPGDNGLPPIHCYCIALICFSRVFIFAIFVDFSPFMKNFQGKNV